LLRKHMVAEFGTMKARLTARLHYYMGLERETGLEPATLCLGRTLVAGN